MKIYPARGELVCAHGLDPTLAFVEIAFPATIRHTVRLAFSAGLTILDSSIISRQGSHPPDPQQVS